MRIGIIGAGNIGGTLARRLTQLGHEVSIANSRGPDTLAGLAKETGARPVTVEQAARAGDVVIVTIPEKSVRDLPKGHTPQSSVHRAISAQRRPDRRGQQASSPALRATRPTVSCGRRRSSPIDVDGWTSLDDRVPC